jgi:lipoic acid synthetase
VGKAPVQAPDASEPTRIGQSVLQMKLKYCVLTMVTRDDLPDGGAQHLCRTVETIRLFVPKIQLELLISDLEGRWDALEQVLALRPQVLNHNIETVPRLYPNVRPQAVYQRSLDLLSRSNEKALITKSGIMLGLGETQREVLHVMDDLRAAGCQLLTMGQYLAPSKRHHPVRRYIRPEEFDDFKTEAINRGFKAVASAPLVRSSFRAEELHQAALRVHRAI